MKTSRKNSYKKRAAKAKATKDTLQRIKKNIAARKIQRRLRTQLTPIIEGLTYSNWTRKRLRKYNNRISYPRSNV